MKGARIKGGAYWTRESWVIARKYGLIDRPSAAKYSSRGFEIEPHLDWLITRLAWPKAATDGAKAIWDAMEIVGRAKQAGTLKELEAMIEVENI